MAGRVVVVSGPSGVGKGTVIRALLGRRPELFLSVSATTRPRRPDEVHGVHYRFLDDAAFDALARSGGLLEWADYAGRRYGTPAAPVMEATAAGADVLLEIEVQGAGQVRERCPGALLILIVPPSLDALAERLHRRGTEEPEHVAARLEAARRELAQAGLFDHVVVNDRLEDAVDELDRIIGASRR